MAGRQRKKSGKKKTGEPRLYTGVQHLTDVETAMWNKGNAAARRGDKMGARLYQSAENAAGNAANLWPADKRRGWPKM